MANPIQVEVLIINSVILYLKQELMDDIKEKYRLMYSGYKYGREAFSLTIKIGMIGYVLHRSILWDQGVNFNEFERRLKAAGIEYSLGGNFYRYDFKSREDLSKVVSMLYDMFFEYQYAKDKGAAVDEYSSEIYGD